MSPFRYLLIVCLLILLFSALSGEIFFAEVLRDECAENDPKMEFIYYCEPTPTKQGNLTSQTGQFLNVALFGLIQIIVVATCLSAGLEKELARKRPHYLRFILINSLPIISLGFAMNLVGYWLGITVFSCVPSCSPNPQLENLFIKPLLTNTIFALSMMSLAILAYPRFFQENYQSDPNPFGEFVNIVFHVLTISLLLLLLQNHLYPMGVYLSLFMALVLAVPISIFLLLVQYTCKDDFLLGLCLIVGVVLLFACCFMLFRYSGSNSGAL